jgi:Family of unknown function (DUF6006)
MKVLNQLFQKRVLGLALLPASVLLTVGTAYGGQVAAEWYFGRWNCQIDGRPAQMQWKVVDDSQTHCSGGVCSSTSGVKVVGWFSDNGGPWVSLSKRYTQGNDFGIRYRGGEPDNWFLRYNPQTKSATGWTTWRGNRYPLSCQKR